MNKVFGFIFCLFIVIEGPWAFVPNDTLSDFLLSNTVAPEELIPSIVHAWSSVAEENGYVYISYDKFKIINDRYLKSLSKDSNKVITPRKDKPIVKSLDKKIDGLLEKLEE